jgi:hypothetical protein
LTDIATRWNNLLETLERLERLENSTDLVGKDHLTVVQQLGGLHLVQPFNWNAWGAEMVPVANLGQLDMDDCVRHITRIVRADRFSEGVLAGAVTSGYLRAICTVARDCANGSRVPELPKAM